MTEYNDVLEFWFGDPNGDNFGEYREIWFEKDRAFDTEIRTRFGKDLARASAGNYDAWETSPLGTLALIVMLDQFSRNIFRGLPKAFAADAKARSIARRVIDQGIDRDFLAVQRLFIYLPFEHSELLEDQEFSVELFENLGLEASIEAAIDHRNIIKKFGRFPYRNKALGRPSTPHEEDFLLDPPPWGKTKAEMDELQRIRNRD